jgi:hypothetical protein
VFLFTALTTAALPPVPEVARLDSVIQNQGFEEGGEQPDWWGRHPAVHNGRNAHARDPDVHRSGQASGKLVFLDPIEGANQSPVQWLKYGLPVEGGSALIFAGWVRADGVRGCRVGLHIYDAVGGHLGFHPIAHPPGAELDWQPFEQTIPLPPAATKVGIALYAAQGGATWYDDVALIATPSRRAFNSYSSRARVPVRSRSRVPS